MLRCKVGAKAENVVQHGMERADERERSFSRARCSTSDDVEASPALSMQKKREREGEEVSRGVCAACVLHKRASARSSKFVAFLNPKVPRNRWFDGRSHNRARYPKLWVKACAIQAQT